MRKQIGDLLKARLMGPDVAELQYNSKQRELIELAEHAPGLYLEEAAEEVGYTVNTAEGILRRADPEDDGYPDVSQGWGHYEDIVQDLKECQGVQDISWRDDRPFVQTDVSYIGPQILGVMADYNATLSAAADGFYVGKPHVMFEVTAEQIEFLQEWHREMTGMDPHEMVEIAQGMVQDDEQFDTIQDIDQAIDVTSTLVDLIGGMVEQAENRSTV